MTCLLVDRFHRAVEQLVPDPDGVGLVVRRLQHRDEAGAIAQHALDRDLADEQAGQAGSAAPSAWSSASPRPSRLTNGSRRPAGS